MPPRPRHRHARRRLPALPLAGALLLAGAGPAVGAATVAWQSERDGNTEIYVAPAARSGTPVDISRHPTADGAPSISADGRTVAWQSERDGNWEIYVAAADGSGTPVNVSTDPADDREPSISGDGLTVGWASGGDGITVLDTPVSEIHVGRSDGSGTPTNISSTWFPDQRPSMSADGRRSAWNGWVRSAASLSGAHYEVFVAAADGSGTPVSIADAGYSVPNPSISADGLTVAWGRYDGIWVSPTDGSGAWAHISSDSASYGPSLSPDGGAVAWTSGDGEILVAPADQTGTPVNISRNPAFDGYPSISATPPAPANCRAVAPRGTPDPVRVPARITASYLRIDQRTGAAAVRRARAIESWLEAGIADADLCGGGLGPRELDPGLVATSGRLGPVPPPAGPRTVRIAPARSRTARFGAGPIQMCINQRIYQAAIARADALAARLSGRLTGGDILDGTLTRSRLRQDLTISAAGPGPAAPASRTRVTRPTRQGCGAVRFTTTQAAINRRIAIASVVRVNTVLDRLAAGLSGDAFAARTITLADFAPGEVP